jgi:hypothetical protein
MFMKSHGAHRKVGRPLIQTLLLAFGLAPKKLDYDTTVTATKKIFYFVYSFPRSVRRIADAPRLGANPKANWVFF